MQNLNPYSASKFKKEFENSDLYYRVRLAVDMCCWENDFSLSGFYSIPGVTIREVIYNRIISMVPFYYINNVLEKKSQTIYDIGCGANLFKQWIPNIVGIDKSTQADVYSHFDDSYIKENKGLLGAIISINALHFIDIIDFEKRISEVVSVLKPSGVAFIAMNLLRILDSSTPESKASELNFVSNLKVNEHGYNLLDSEIEYIQNYIHAKLRSIQGITFSIIDVNIGKDADNAFDGNIRMVFEKGCESCKI